MIRLFSAVLSAAFLFVGRAAADTTIFSPGTTPIVESGWTSLGVGPAAVQVLTPSAVYIMEADAQPAVASVGHPQRMADGRVSYEVTSYLWARADVSGGRPVVVVTPIAMGAAQSQTFPATIANAGSLSGAIDLGATHLFAIRLDPTAWTAASLTFQASIDGTNFFNLYDNFGSEVGWTVAAQTIVLNASPAQWLGIRWLKIRSGTASSPVAQGAARALTVVGVP